jgi:putative tryptophan/tyrosine transport system substrate-binding protein
VDRRRFLLTSLTGALAAPLAAEAQPQAQVARVGVIPSGSPATSAASVDAFRQRLRELGYVEGRNIAIEVRYAVAQTERFRGQAAELVGLEVDVIVASGTLATRAAKDETSTIPIVMVAVGDAVGAGLVKSLSRPGGNITGHSFLGPELALKGFDLLTEAIPRATRFAVLFNPEIAPDPLGFRALGAAAQAKGVTLQPVELRRADDLNHALAAMGQARPNALLVFAASPAQQNRIVEFAAKNRFPALYGFREAVDAGGLMSFGPKFLDLWRGAGNYVDKILKGAKPADLPVEQPTKFELVINLKTAAKALGLTIPPSLLARTDQVIE